MGKPTIRFKGYTDDWEQRKLGDYLEVSKEKNRDALFGKEDVLSVSGEFGIVNQIEFQGRSFAGVSVANYGVVEVEDVVYTKSPLKSNPYGIIKTNKGKSGIVSTLYAVYKPKNNVDSEFVQIYFELDSRMNSYMHPLVNKGAKNDMKVSDENALKGPVIFPSIEEQKTISQYFDKLNCLITLHQCKCDQAKILKKYMLQKMFPQNDEKVPKIRFKSFTDDWELRKVTELLKNSSSAMKIGPFGSALKKEYFVEEGIKVYAQENAFTGDFSMGDYYITEDKYKELKSCELYPGDLVISMMGTIGACAIFPKNAEKGIMNSHLLRLQFNNEVIPEYIMYLLRDSVLIRKQIDRLSVGSIMSGLSSSVVKKLVFPISKLAEQKRIVEYLDSIDHLITLHQHKCEELKNIKKFMLQNMFVQEK